MDKKINTMNRQELKEHILQIQNFINDEKNKGKDIDTILDETDVFDEFEEILPDNEFPIFVITVLNGFRSDIIFDNILDVIESSKNGHKN